MGAVEIGELINLIVDLALLPLIVAVLVLGRMPRRGFLTAGVLCIVLSHLATVLETFFLPDGFDAMEHALFAAAAICFLTVLLSGKRVREAP